jgi:hypothetical protein
MNKRRLNRLAVTGYFKSANGAFYAAAKRALRKPPFLNYASVIDEPDRESLAAFDFSSKAVNGSPKISPPKARDKKQSR